MTGHDESELVGRPVWDFAASQRARAEFKAEFSRYVAEQPSPVPRIAKYQTKDGRSIDVQMDWIYKRDGAGFVTGFVSIVTDITERTRAQGALREREERYRSLYNDTPALMHSIDRDMRVVNVSDYWLTFFGYQRSEVLGRGITDFIADTPGQAPFSEAWKDFLTQGAAHNVHRRYVNKSGEIIDVLVSATTECDEAGEVTLSHSVLLDVTERFHAESALRASEERFRHLYNDTPALMYSLDREMRFANVSDHWLRVMGYERGDVIGHPFTDFLTESSRNLALAHFPHYLKSGILSEVPRQIVKKSGEVMDVLISATAHLAIMVDVTAREKAEEALRESEGRFRRLYNDTPALMYSLDREMRFVNVSDYWLGVMGYERSEVIGRHFADFLTEDSRERLHEDFPSHLERARNVPRQLRKKRSWMCWFQPSPTATKPEKSSVRCRSW